MKLENVYKYFSIQLKLHNINEPLFLFSSDVWSAGCVLAELLLGQPIFPGDSGVDQLVEIIKVRFELEFLNWKAFCYYSKNTYHTHIHEKL